MLYNGRINYKLYIMAYNDLNTLNFVDDAVSVKMLHFT